MNIFIMAIVKTQNMFLFGRTHSYVYILLFKHFNTNNSVYLSRNFEYLYRWIKLKKQTTRISINYAMFIGIITI